MKGWPKSLFAAAIILFGAATLYAGDGKSEKPKGKSEVKMQIGSAAFQNGDSIPVKYTCDGHDVSPPLIFVGVSGSAKSLALICDDPDAPAGTWVHWVLYDIPPYARGLSEKIMEAVNPVVKVEGRVLTLSQGRNDFGKYGYGGPCPPKGKPHRYFFKLYALDIELKIDKETVVKGVTKEVLLERMKEHIVAEASLMGKYQRK